MAGRFARGWSMARESFTVLKRYPRLAVFPAISGAVFLLVVGAIAVTLLPQLGAISQQVQYIAEQVGCGFIASNK